MDTAQEQKKKAGTGSPATTSAPKGDVFDKLGNDGVKAQIDQAKAQPAEEEEPSMLALVEAETAAPEKVVEEVEDQEVVTEVLEEEEPAIAIEEVEAEETVPAELAAEEVLPPEVIEEEQPELAPQLAEEEQPVVAVEVEEPEVEDLIEPEEVPESEVANEEEEQVEADKAEVIVEKEEPEKAPALAAMAGVDPVLAMDPKKLGNSDQAKEKALGPEGHQKIAEAVAAATSALGRSGALDDNAKAMVAQQVRDELDVSDIVQARQENRLDDLVHSALRANALRSRDEVIFLLQQVMQDENELARMAAGGDVGVALIEHLAVDMSEVSDLYALAAYDHGDILKKVVLTDQALAVRRHLTPMALRMGGFSSVLYQLVANEFEKNPMPEDAVAEVVEGDGGAAPEQSLASSASGLRSSAPRADPGKVPVIRHNLQSIANQLRQFRTAAA